MSEWTRTCDPSGEGGSPAAPAEPNPGVADFADKCRTASCRSCGQAGLEPVLDLGMMPLSDGFVPAERLAEPDERFALDVAFCPACGLMQILETVPPEKLFCEDYPYYSSFSDTLLAHSRENALELIEGRGLGRDSFVVEVASNDGYLLRNFVERGIEVLGIDPAEGPARAARSRGVPTTCAFFGKELARSLREERGPADVLLANNVLAHVADTNGFVQGIRTLLADDGVAVIEVPYVRDLIDHGEFDTIYHEHLCYFSVTALDHLFRRNGLFLNDVRRLSIHGGSLRLYVERVERVGERVREMLAAERRDGLDQPAYYRGFARRVETFRGQMRALLADLKERGARLAAYGAAAKGTIMLNYIGVDADTIEFVVDRNVHKQGKYVPGVRIPIAPTEALLERRPDYTLILAWNFKDEIMRQQAAYADAGGRFIVPIPQPEIVAGA